MALLALYLYTNSSLLNQIGASAAGEKSQLAILFGKSELR